MASRRGLTGPVAPDRVIDPEARRSLISLMARIQWILDNWPETTTGAAVAAAGGGGGTPATYLFQKSIENAAGIVALVNDEETPGVSKMYGTDATGARGWFPAVSAPSDPPTFSTIGDATEGAEAAETTTKTFNDADGLKLNIMTRVAYYDAGDKKLYGYVRELRFDKNGMLYLVGAETRVTVDIPVAES